jgi:upstream activation factor subunit UAF30
MPRQTKSSKTQKESEVVVEQQVVETPVVETQPEKKRKSKKPVAEVQSEESVPVSAPVETPSKQRKSRKAEPVPEEKTEESVVEEQEHKDSSDKRRREVTRETLDQDFDELLKFLNDETESLRSSDSKTRTTGVKFLRQVVKRVKTLKSDTQRVSKQRNRSSRPANTSSGFMKPVKISKEMAKFTGWNPEELKSRVSITKALCQYIKDNNLQNPEDRRQIVPDPKLAKLLDYDQKRDGKPLTYYYLQQKIQPHFSSE